jgi:hypothetical protein
MSENNKDDLQIQDEFANRISEITSPLARINEITSPAVKIMSQIAENYAAIGSTIQRTYTPISAMVSAIADSTRPLVTTMKALQNVMQPTFEYLSSLEKTLKTLEPPTVSLSDILVAKDSIRHVGVDLHFAQNEVNRIKQYTESEDEPDLEVIEECASFEAKLLDAQKRREVVEENFYVLFLEKLDEIAVNTAAMRQNSEVQTLILYKILDIYAAKNKEEAKSKFEEFRDSMRNFAGDVQAAQALWALGNIALNGVSRFFL